MLCMRRPNGGKHKQPHNPLFRSYIGFGKEWHTVSVDFQFPDKEERMKRNLRDIFTRSSLTTSEIKTLYRVVEFLKKS